MNPACTTELRGGHRSFVAALVVFIIVILVAAPQAQQPVAFSGSPGAINAKQWRALKALADVLEEKP